MAAREDEKGHRRRAVVVTGMGCLTPIGNDPRTFWTSLLEGRTGAARVESFDPAPYRTQVGCEVKGFPSNGGGDGSGRATLLAIEASRQAILQSGMDPAVAGSRLGVSLGTTMGEPCFLDRLTGESAESWPEALAKTPSSITTGVARTLGIRGLHASLPAACSAGNYAVGLALDLIREGRIDAALAGGSEAFSESAFAGFSRLNALSPDVCRPFDRDRQGLLLGEGAGVLLLESEDSALRRGARILARILGYGLSCDAHHITGPHPEGEGAAACMRNALADAGRPPGAVDYVSCHGTGTVQNDRIEALAIRKVFGDRAPSLPVSSIKALTGHMMGAASAVEAIACVLALEAGVLPPTWNHRNLDPACELDVIPNEPRSVRARIVLNNSYAFGGNNACVALAAA